jgi:hypothetical protein
MDITWSIIPTPVILSISTLGFLCLMASAIVQARGGRMTMTLGAGVMISWGVLLLNSVATMFWHHERASIVWIGAVLMVLSIILLSTQIYVAGLHDAIERRAHLRRITLATRVLFILAVLYILFALAVRIAPSP